jgi:hypothetical protein
VVPDAVPDADAAPPIRLQVGALSREQLLAALTAAGVGVNASAEVLLGHEVFERQQVEAFDVVQRTVGQLGLTEGASLSTLLATAQAQGLALCPSSPAPTCALRCSTRRRPRTP